MEPVSRSWLSRLMRKPLAIIGAIGSVLVVLANAPGAIDGTGNLWRRWTAPPTQLESTWQGHWLSRDGYDYAFALQLEVGDAGVAEGEISWQLKATPKGSHLETRVGSVGKEYVRGRFDRASGIATLTGYKVSDPTLLALDSYKFQIKPDKISFVGMSKHRGEWEAQASGTVIVTEKY